MLLTRLLPQGYALCVGSLAGWVWATVLVDFEPAWYQKLPHYQQIGILVIPLFLTFTHAVVAKWWGAGVHAVYAVTLQLWWVAGSLRNELQHVGNFQHIVPLSCGLIFLSGIVLSTTGWYAGRLVRKLARKADD